MWKVAVQRRARLSGLPRGIVQRCVRRTLEVERAPGCEVCVVLTGDDEIRELNRTWRDIDAPTDVLSFPQLEGMELPTVPEGEDELLPLGDIVVSLETIARQADELSVGADACLAHAVVHGVLHLLGHDHADAEEKRAMQARELLALSALGYPPVLWDEAEPPGGLPSARLHEA